MYMPEKNTPTESPRDFIAARLLPPPRRLVLRGGFSPADRPVQTTIDPRALNHRSQSYQLSIGADRIQIIAADEPGLFYARQTLTQLRRLYPSSSPIPRLTINDWPDFPVRGVMLDISRDKVPKTKTLLALVDRLAEWKFNQLQLYIEHTFAYQGHEPIWQHASPMTRAQIRLLDAYCRARHIDLVPNQNSFGHMERWLRHPDCIHLAEARDGADTPWGYRWTGPFSLCPTDPRSIKFLAGLYDQLLPNFTSRLFNVGCDETFDIGQGRSQRQCQRIGVDSVYINFLKKVRRLVRDRGRTMQFWGDIILKSPQRIKDLPRDIIALQWAYEAADPIDAQAKHFADAGIPFYVCPGTSSWLSITGRTDNAIANIKSSAAAGLRHGAAGLLVTDWGDHGHLQYPFASDIGLAVAASHSWCAKAAAKWSITKSLDAQLYLDPANTVAQVIHDLGNVYQSPGKLIPNASILFRILVPTSARTDPMLGLQPENLQAAEHAVHSALSRLTRSRMNTPNADLIKDELKNAAAMLTYACHIGQSRLGSPILSDRALADEFRHIIKEHRRLWLIRNRPGGLTDSASRLCANPRPFSE